MKYERFEQLPVWQASIDLAVQTYEMTSKPAFRRQRTGDEFGDSQEVPTSRFGVIVQGEFGVIVQGAVGLVMVWKIRASGGVMPVELQGPVAGVTLSEPKIPGAPLPTHSPTLPARPGCRRATLKQGCG